MFNRGIEPKDAMGTGPKKCITCGKVLEDAEVHFGMKSCTHCFTKELMSIKGFDQIQKEEQELLKKFHSS